MYPTTTSYYRGAEIGVWGIVSIILAICGGIVLYFTFLSPKNADKYTGFTKKLYDFLSFRIMSLEMILKIAYLIAALFITLSSFSVISTSFIAFILYLFIGNILIRLMFEGSILILMIYRRLGDIHDALKTPTKKVEKAKEEK
ncbi:MAG: hypothetical protein IJ743_00070 [Bacilli bacterium]|nr:hypothetical protein [Bacilli bacterium]